MKPKREYVAGEDVLTYTELDLDRGVGMTFHPVSGIPLNRLRYNSRSRRFYSTFHYGGWSLESDITVFDRISNGSCWKMGDQFPEHWRFHPLSGKKLQLCILAPSGRSRGAFANLTKEMSCTNMFR